jgi:hypothetical protein
MRPTIPILLLIFMMLVGSACTGPAVEQQTVDLPSESGNAGTEEPEVDPTASDIEMPEPAVIDPPETLAAASPQAKPTARPQMEATLPESVQLASGQLQLVEFFAFW